MNFRKALYGSLLGSAVLLSGCNDTNTPRTVPPPTTPTASISNFVTSLIAMITGAACDTASPTALESVNLVDDMTVQDANQLTENCAS